MSQLPKLKIKLLGSAIEEVCEFEEAKDRLTFGNGTIMVEGQMVHTYDELVIIATQDSCKGKEFIAVKLAGLAIPW